MSGPRRRAELIRERLIAAAWPGLTGLTLQPAPVCQRPMPAIATRRAAVVAGLYVPRQR